MLKETLVVANFKCHLTETDFKKWLFAFKKEIGAIKKNSTAVLCPPLPFLFIAKKELSCFPEIRFGVQNVSKFEEGSYTGEVSIKQLSGLIDYAIVGHSERRRFFRETNEEIFAKINLCQKYKVVPILCVSNTDQVKSLKNSLTDSRAIIAFEPIEAIGTKNPESPKKAMVMAKKIKEELGKSTKVLYGGSVDSKNVKSFTQQNSIDGVLVGNASLDPLEFSKIVNCE